MKPIAKLTILAFAIALLACLTSKVDAKCAEPPPPCQAYRMASAVFVGRVAEITSTEVETNQGARKSRYPQASVRFVVEQAYKGVHGLEVEIIEGDVGRQSRFKQGEQYFVYAYRHPQNGRLQVGRCTPVISLADAKDHLEYVRELPQAIPGSRIFGSVVQYRSNLKERTYNLIEPLANIEITIEAANGKRFGALTDREGHYKIVGLRPGTYTVRAALPEHLDGEPVRKIDVTHGGCAEASFFASANSRISGKVLDAEGQPVPDISVELIPVDVKEVDDDFFMKIENHYSNEHGRYELKEVPPGRYLMGINLSDETPNQYTPYPRTYFPGVKDRNQATVISVGEHQKLEDYDLHLPPRLAEGTITGSVLWPNGRPAVGARVRLVYTDHEWNVYDEVETDSHGRYSIKGYEGFEYWLKALTTTDANGKEMRKVWEAEPMKLLVTGNISRIKLVIASPNTPAPGSPKEKK